MTTKELKQIYGYRKLVDNDGKVYIAVNINLSKQDALRLANCHFKCAIANLGIRKAFATKNGKKIYFKRKLTVIGEKPVWAVYLA